MPREKLRSLASEEGVRPYRPADRSAFLDLYEAVWDVRKGSAWFEWRFEENPYADAVSMVVAEADGQVVGAEPLLAFPLRAGDRVLDALQPVDWMVHPDHRERGHFARMTEAVLERYATDADLLFNFPNRQIRPGLESFGWQVVGRIPTSYRIHRPAALVPDRGPGVATASRLCGRLLRAYDGVVGRRGTTPDDVSVTRHDAVPVDVVRDLYVETRPSCIHVPRERAFLSWRFDNPRWDVRSYVAARDGEPVASVVTASESVDGARLTRVLDVQPMRDPSGDRSDAVRALLGAVVADADDAALVTAPATLDSSVLGAHGFRRDDSLPLAALASPTTLAVRRLGAERQERSRAREDVATHAVDASTGSDLDAAADSAGAADDSADDATGECGHAAAADGGPCLAGWDPTDRTDWLLTPADQDVA